MAGVESRDAWAAAEEEVLGESKQGPALANYLTAVEHRLQTQEGTAAYHYISTGSQYGAWKATVRVVVTKCAEPAGTSSRPRGLVY